MSRPECRGQGTRPLGMALGAFSFPLTRRTLDPVSALEFEPDKPWARQPFETDLGFALFGEYLGLPLPRQLTKLRQHQLTWSQLSETAFNGHWKERAALWDEHLAKIRSETLERVTEETAAQVAARQVRLTKRMQSIADLELAKLERVVAQNDFTAVELRDVIRLALNGIKLERLVRGEVTERVETGPEVGALSLEELREARRLQAKAGIR